MYNMKSFIKWAILCWFSLVYGEYVGAQDAVKTFERDFKPARVSIFGMALEMKDYGIKYGTSTQQLSDGQSIEVEVKSKDQCIITALYTSYPTETTDYSDVDVSKLYDFKIENSNDYSKFSGKGFSFTPCFGGKSSYNPSPYNKYYQFNRNNGGVYNDPFNSFEISVLRNRAHLLFRELGETGELYSLEDTGASSHYENIGASYFPVEIKVTFKGGASPALVNEISLPGIGSLYPEDFDDLEDLRIDVYRSSNTEPDITQTYFSYDPDKVLDLVMGDSVVFRAKDPNFIVKNLPEIWIARTGGETRYMYTPSIKPGEFRPFLGFDSQVHGVALRKYPDGFQLRQPEVVYDAAKQLFTWYWIAQTRMDVLARFDDYGNSNLPKDETFSKYKLFKDFPSNNPGFKIGKDPSGNEQYVTRQRNNQREGYNMQFLHAWQDKNYTAYNGKKYILGLDPDELIYIGSKNAEVSATNKPTAILAAGIEEWKVVPDGERGVISEMVTAYQKNRTAFLGVGPVVDKMYSSEELYDHYSYGYKGQTANDGEPEPGCNNKPCVVYDPSSGRRYGSIRVRGDKIKYEGVSFPSGREISINLDMNVVAPLVNPYVGGYDPSSTKNDFGFYGSLEGEQYPAEDQKQVPYSLLGLEGLPETERSKFYMEYTNENELGMLYTETRKYTDANFADGKWTERFDIKGWGYNEITVYYERLPGAKKVPIGGKELMEINLRFSSVPGSKYSDFSPTPFEGVDLKEGRGEGKFWYLRDFGDDPDNHDDRFGDRDYEVSKSYTFSKNDKVTFTAMDSDPHSFFHYTTEFYVSERFMSKRLMPDRLGASSDDIQWFLTGYDNKIDDGNSIGWGRTLQYEWKKPGVYRLTASYHGNKFAHKITVTDGYYSGVPNDFSKKATINLYKLSPDQLSWLNENPQNGAVDDDFMVARVSDIYSKYTYMDGPRALRDDPDKEIDTDVLDNRFGLDNDFNARFAWFKNNSNAATSEGEIVNKFIVDPRPNWFPSNWIRHYSGDLPVDIDPAALASIGGIKSTDQEIANVLDVHYPTNNPEKWQWRLPWTSSTHWNAYRIRANIKAVYKMHELFNNDYGAFSGKGNLNYVGNDQAYLDAVSSPLPAFTSTEKTKYDFFMDLSGRRKLIFDPKNTAKVDELSVYSLADEREDYNKAFFLDGPPKDPKSEFIKGVDLSGVKNMEDEGIRWNIDGVQIDPYKMVADKGANMVRFRLWVDPKYADGTPYPYSTLTSVTEEILRAKQKGLKVLLDLHYSDTWTDPERNIIPARWRGISDISRLSDNIYSYTVDVLTHLNANVALPDYIQIGNETNSNIMLSEPYADLSIAQVAAEIGVTEAQMNGNKFTINWDRNASLLNSGLNAVVDFNWANTTNIKTMLHIAGPDNADYWINEAFNNHTPGRVGTMIVDHNLVDVIGMSYYRGLPDQKQTLPRLKSIIEGIKTYWDKETLIAETAFPFTYSYSDNYRNLFGTNASTSGTGGWPVEVSATVQADWLIQLRETLKITNGAIGFLYWEPFWVGSHTAKMKDGVGSNWENMTFFSFNTGSPSVDNTLDFRGGIRVFCDPCTYPAQPPFYPTAAPPNEQQWAQHDTNSDSFTRLALYPNPSKDGNVFVKLKVNKTSPATMQIMDLSGKIIHSANKESISAGEHIYSLGSMNLNLAAGVYFVRIVTKEFDETRKLMIEN
jgi:arabinogalactan endo-1,4-beta-galactosidase